MSAKSEWGPYLHPKRIPIAQSPLNPRIDWSKVKRRPHINMGYRTTKGEPR